MTQYLHFCIRLRGVVPNVLQDIFRAALRQGDRKESLTKLP
jgi:hypothetical protein